MLKVMLAAAILLGIIGYAFRWEYRSVTVAEGRRNRPAEIRTNRWTGEAQTFDQRLGWRPLGSRSLSRVVDGIIADTAP